LRKRLFRKERTLFSKTLLIKNDFSLFENFNKVFL
jgi:hypothetical protein